MFPPIELGNGDDWEIGLVNLCTYNSIPNVEKGENDLFIFDGEEIVIPEGSYEISDIERYIKSKIKKKIGQGVSIIANNNTLKCEIKTTGEIDFTKPNSIGRMLGFGKVKLTPGEKHISQDPITIIRVNSVRVDCNIARGSYTNGVEGHTIHEFFPSVAPGFKIVESPPTIIYTPVNTNCIQNITIKLVDQDGRIINFREETITIRLHLRRKV